MERQLENEKAGLLERKRREQAEQKRKQAELERILDENRRKVLFCAWGNIAHAAADSWRAQVDAAHKSALSDRHKATPRCCLCELRPLGQDGTDAGEGAVLWCWKGSRQC